MKDGFQDTFLKSLSQQYLRELEHACHGKQCPPDAHPQISAAPAPVDPSYLYAIESMLLKHLDSRELKLRIAASRDNLTDLLTRESYEAISNEFIEDLNAASRDDLLAEATYLTARVHRRYTAVPAVERLRANVAQYMAYSILVIMLLVGTALTALSFWNPTVATSAGIACAAMVAGALGAAVSTTVRLYGLDPRHEPGNTWLSITSGRSTILVAPLLGMVFALVLLLLMRGDLVSGDLFPNFRDGPLAKVHPFAGSSGLCADDCVSALGDFAKLMVWSFLAGWAERMVPDVLDRLAAQAQTPREKK